MIEDVLADEAVAPGKGARTRARVLEAAATHFASLGFERGSLPEIARQVGVSHATLYQHFGRKEALFRAAVEADLTALFATIHPAIEEADDAASLVGLLPCLALASEHYPLARRVLADINAEQNEALHGSPALLDLEARLVRAVRRIQDAHRVRADIDAERFAAGLIALTLPLLVVALRMGDADDVPRASDALPFLADILRPPTTKRKTRPCTST